MTTIKLDALLKPIDLSENHVHHVLSIGHVIKRSTKHPKKFKILKFSSLKEPQHHAFFRYEEEKQARILQKKP
jgi:hypothetical protein